MVKKAFPHFITLANLFCGCVASYFAFQHQFNAALTFVFLGVFFDFFDGFFARLLKVESQLGVQLDSMADLITSGVAPGITMHQLFVLSGVKTIDFTWGYTSDFPIQFTVAPLALLGFLIPIGAAVRLARFNLLPEPLPYFKGLPAPAAALFVMGLPLLLRHPGALGAQPLFWHPLSLIFLSVFTVFLMNIHWRMFSLKFQGDMQTLLFPVLLFLTATVGFVVLGVAALSIVILCYILLSVIKHLLKK